LGNKNGGLLTFSAVASAGTLIRNTIRMFRTFSFKDKVVVITGGSRGLGLVMARQLAALKARIALIARDEIELQQACNELKSQTEVCWFACDVTSEEQVNNTIAKVLDAFGTIDVLINDAGVIQVGPVEAQTVADFESAMHSHFFGPLYMVMAVLPAMRQKRFGRIVNISSIGGKMSVPHLLPYCSSKFALVGFSEGLRLEAMKDNIYVTTVCPGLMRTGSHVQAEFKGHNEIEYALFSTFNALPVISTAAEAAAKQILNACKCGDAELVISMPAQLAIKLKSHFPELTADVLSIVDKFLPPAGGIGVSTRKGKDSQSKWSPNVLTTGIERAANNNNEFATE
jgi:short-subunit dehydrogenase